MKTTGLLQENFIKKNTPFCFSCIIIVCQIDGVTIFRGGTQTKTGQHKMQPHQNWSVNHLNSRKWKGKQKGNPSKAQKTRRETQENRINWNVAYCVSPKRDPKPKHTETGFTVTHIFVFLCCFQAISLLVFFILLLYLPCTFILSIIYSTD